MTSDFSLNTASKTIVEQIFNGLKTKQTKAPIRQNFMPGKNL